VQSETPYRDALREVSAFFEREGAVWETLRLVCDRLQRGGVEYAVYGDMAMVLHGFNRCTDTIEILVTADGSARARNQFGVGTASVRLRFIAAGDKVTSGANDLRFPGPSDVTVAIDGYRVVALPILTFSDSSRR
jgi:hypothetical protein